MRDRRIVRFELRLYPDERRRLGDVARTLGYSLSELARLAMNTYAAEMQKVRTSSIVAAHCIRFRRNVGALRVADVPTTLCRLYQQAAAECPYSRPNRPETGDHAEPCNLQREQRRPLNHVAGGWVTWHGHSVTH